LESCTLSDDQGLKIPFDVEPFRRHCLLNGLDDIGLTQQKQTKIKSYEQKAQAERPWA
jgi:3-isopropylmalate/(R)-2-methylmalate dehydratase small subunit